MQGAPPARTIIVAETGIDRPLAWPLRQPDDDLDHSVDLTLWLAAVNDSLLSVAWSATGGLLIANLWVTGGVVTAWLSGFIVGATHLVKCEFTTVGGRTIELVVRVRVSSLLAAAPVAPSLSFGTPVIWNGGGMPGVNVAAAGATQATATVLAQAECIVVAAPAGSGVILNAAVGWHRVWPRAGANFFAYPSAGTGIEKLGMNIADTMVDGAGPTLFVFDGVSTWRAG